MSESGSLRPSNIYHSCLKCHCPVHFRILENVVSIKSLRTNRLNACGVHRAPTDSNWASSGGAELWELLSLLQNASSSLYFLLGCQSQFSYLIFIFTNLFCGRGIHMEFFPSIMLVIWTELYSCIRLGGNFSYLLNHFPGSQWLLIHLFYLPGCLLALALFWRY